MLIAVISDTHDNIPNIEKFLKWAKENKIEMIIHCGDIAAPSMINELFAPLFGGEMHFVFGNVADREILPKVMTKYPNTKLHGDSGELEIDGLRIAFCHRPEEAKGLAESNKYNLVFYGHTHKPGMETLPNNCQLINPGTLGGVFQKATFAVFDTATKNIELKVLEKL
jgi:putative phosphoesterase